MAKRPLGRPITTVIAALALAATSASTVGAAPTGAAPAEGGSAPREEVLYDRDLHQGIAMRYLTRDDTDRFVVRRRPGAVRVDAPRTNTELNTRIAMVPRRVRSAVDGGSCATWTGAIGAFAQQGVALRVRRDGTRARAIVVTKNVFFGASWQFNVTTWDTDREPYLVTHGAVQLTVPFLVGSRPAPLPWTVCARTEGAVVRVKGWRTGDAEPAWSDPHHTGTVQLPDEWVIAGRSGWFAGHLPPGASLALEGLRTWANPASNERSPVRVTPG